MKYSITMRIKVSGLVRYLMQEAKLNFRDSLKLIYNSQLFADLEDEKTKIWHYSEILLFDLLMQEKTKGKAEYPNV